MKHLLTGIMLAGLSLSSHAFTLTSPSVIEGSRMSKWHEFNGFGCHGDNLSPALIWKNAPKGTKSYAITVFDPDAPTESGFWHWVVTDIPANITSLKKGESSNLKHSKQMINDYGLLGFGGACPPNGEGMHRYQFTVWALPTQTLPVPKGASNAVIGFTLNATNIGKAQLTATYVR